MNTDVAMAMQAGTSTGGRASEALRRGDKVGGRYALLREIARGAMATIFEARHLVTGRTVALKFVTRECAQRDLATERIHRAATALGPLRHPNVVEVIDAGEAPECGSYVAMEMLEGRTLEGILAARRRLPLDEALWIARCAGEGLAHAHRRGTIHRDVRPANVFIARTQHGAEVVKLIDFGIAVRESDEPPSSTLSRAAGTLEYMPPEVLGKPARRDPKSDQYALAAVLLECLAGNLPSMPDGSGAPAGFAELKELVPDVPPEAVAALRRAMAPVPGERFDDIESFLAAVGAADAKPAQVLHPSRPGGADARPTTPVPQDRPFASRRRHERAPYITPCRVLRADGSHVDGRSEDISEGGLLIVLSHKEETKIGGAPQASAGTQETVTVRFASPTSGTVVNVNGMVRWAKDGRGRTALGIEFSDLAPEAKQAIATYVSLVGGGTAASA